MKKESDNGKMEKIEKAEENIIAKFKSSPYFYDIIIVVLIVIAASSYAIWSDLNSRIYIEKGEIIAPQIMISSPYSGQIDKVFVSEGDLVSKGKAIASVNGNLVYPKTQGIIISVKNVPGQMTGPTDYIAKMIEPKELRLNGRVEEDKGFADIKVGQKVIFTVDAYGSKKYEGYVEKISPSSRDSDVVFSISDKREVKQYNVKVKFDIDNYPELKNGMSAKLWIYK